MDKFGSEVCFFRKYQVIQKDKKWQGNRHFLGKYTKKITYNRGKINRGEPPFLHAYFEIQEESCYKKCSSEQIFPVANSINRFREDWVTRKYKSCYKRRSTAVEKMYEQEKKENRVKGMEN
jgi:hypothetical protein